MSWFHTCTRRLEIEEARRKEAGLSQPTEEEREELTWHGPFGRLPPDYFPPLFATELVKVGPMKSMSAIFFLQFLYGRNWRGYRCNPTHLVRREAAFFNRGVQR